MESKIFIPNLCKVGFLERKDTFSKRLGYVIYNDGKTWRKETSWNGWITDVISKEEFEERKLKDFNSRRENQIVYYKRNVEQNTEEGKLSQEEYLKRYKLDCIENFQYYKINLIIRNYLYF